MNKCKSIKRSIKLNICSFFNITNEDIIKIGKLFECTHVVNNLNGKVHTIDCPFVKRMKDIKCIKSSKVKNYVKTECKLCK